MQVLHVLKLAAIATIASIGLLLGYDGKKPQEPTAQQEANGPFQVNGAAPGHGKGRRLVLKLNKIHDRANNVESHTLLAPRDWTVKGSAFWPAPAFRRVMPSQQIAVSGPNGEQVHVNPTFMASDFLPSALGQQYGQRRPAEKSMGGGMPVLYCPDGLPGWRDFYQRNVIPHEQDRSITNQRVVSVTPVPTLKDALDKALGPAIQQMQPQMEIARRAGLQTSFNTLALGFQVEFEKNGQTFERLHLIGATQLVMTRPMGTAIEWGTVLDVVYSAPKGTLRASLPVMTVISRSVRATNAWHQAVCQRYRLQTEADRRASFHRHQVNMSAMRQISDASHQRFRSQSRRSDASHSRLINAIRGVEMYRQGDYQYELPNYYPHVFGDGNGNFILTENSLYDPATDRSLPGNWSKLSPMRQTAG